ncbi:MAG: hypothetical protein HYW23_03095 [Candidatus Aenigmarchaeota archaeon]|nr:hypothetical protein [Candidatus Aenigmarchaeota archaeon]
MKGISTVIATILMLMITIALAGTAYLYFQGVFTSQTAVVLDLSGADCTGDPITISVSNHGTTNATTVTVSATAPDGTSAGAACTISNLAPTTTSSCSINRDAGKPSGVYSASITANNARPVRGPVTCTTAGV